MNTNDTTGPTRYDAFIAACRLTADLVELAAGRPLDQTRSDLVGAAVDRMLDALEAVNAAPPLAGTVIELRAPRPELTGDILGDLISEALVAGFAAVNE